MTDVEIKLTANLDSATKEISAFRKEYADLVRTVEKPLRQTNATKALEQQLENTSASVRETKSRLKDLQDELVRTERPSVKLTQAYRDANSELSRLLRTEAQQSTQLSRMRAELTAAGVDTTRLTQEQRRLNAELNKGLDSGRKDLATLSLRQRAAALAQVTREQRLSNIEAAKENLGVSRYRALQAELVRLQNQYKLLRSVGGLTNRELAVAQQTLTARVRETQRALKETADLQRGGAGAGLGGTVAAVGGGIGLLETARAYVNITDSAKKMTAQLNLATSSQAEFQRAQAETYRLAQNNQAPLEDVVTLYSRLAPALKEAGRGQEDTIKIIDAVTKSLRISGATVQETAATIQQFAQALGSGVLRGEEFNTLAESSPRLLKALADALEVNVGALRDMAAEGQLTAEVISNALIGQLPKLTEEAEKLPETFGGAVTKLTNNLVLAVSAIDKITGASDSAIEKLGIFSQLLGTISSATPSTQMVDLITNLSKIPLSPVEAVVTGSLKFYELMTKKTREAAEAAAASEAESQKQREEQSAAHQKVMRDQQAQFLKDTESSLDKQVKATKTKLAEQVAAERQATRDLATAQKERVDNQKAYSDALTKLDAGQGGASSFGTATALKAGARQALQSGDVEEAKRQAQAALEVLTQLADAGENTYGFKGFIRELAAIQDAADQSSIDDAQVKLDKAKEAVQITQQALESLKDLKVTAGMKPEDQAKLLNEMAELARKIGVILTVPVTAVAPVASDQAAPTETISAFAGGGLLRGPGSGTSDSILMYGSNGEFMQPEASVRYYGQDFMEAIRQRKIPRYAQGGLISPTYAPSIPAMGPAPTSPVSSGDWGTLMVDLGGGVMPVAMPRSVAAELREVARKVGSARPTRR
jgi:tape measure domain-containing protein